MALKLYLVALVFLVSCSYSYSDTVSGTTQNAAKDNISWTMDTILPQYTGLTVTAVKYSYTAVKLPNDPLVVSVQNYNAQGSGYVFRSRDDWTKLPGNSITKIVPTDNIPIQYWGSGEITLQGKGSVVDPYVAYSYRYDTCFNNTTDPKCPGYKPSIPEIKYNDPLDDEFVKKSLEHRTILETEEERERNSRLLKKEQQEEKKKSAIVSKTIQNSLITAEAAAQSAAFESLNNIPRFALYYKVLPGGVYPETLKYVDKVLPDSRNRLKLNFSQEQLHNKLIDLQYGNKPQGLQND